MWDCWRKGESLQHIVQLFDRNHSPVQGILAETGGIRQPQKHGSRSRQDSRHGIAQRTPRDREDRAVPGHSEGGLLCGSGSSQIATLVERQTRCIMLIKIARKDNETAINAFIRHASKLPRQLYKFLTWDRGTEMAGHRRFTVATDIQVYFCDPQHPWQHGSNESTNGLLRQYFPKGTDLSVYSRPNSTLWQDD
ncbi:IS30 family transposase [Paraburkholderia sp. RL17-347-BIC-D]|uniref:IS30 family transposase n=1 Tax=Paraburkholderia sp. RL17-347-BIC-D TaxID=3031632 RepID=UPI0038BB4700